MTEGTGNQVLTDVAWAVWEPLIEEVRPRGKTPPKELRRTISAIFWRHQNGAKWRSIPAELGPWWLGARPGPRRPALFPGHFPIENIYRGSTPKCRPDLLEACADRPVVKGPPLSPV